MCTSSGEKCPFCKIERRFQLGWTHIIHSYVNERVHMPIETPHRATFSNLYGMWVSHQHCILPLRLPATKFCGKCEDKMILPCHLLRTQSTNSAPRITAKLDFDSSLWPLNHLRGFAETLLRPLNISTFWLITELCSLLCYLKAFIIYINPFIEINKIGLDRKLISRVPPPLHPHLFK